MQDRNGREIKVGDAVNVRCVVLEVVRADYAIVRLEHEDGVDGLLSMVVDTTNVELAEPAKAESESVKARHTEFRAFLREWRRDFAEWVRDPR